jgi:gliding motility-associated-like protein
VYITIVAENEGPVAIDDYLIGGCLPVSDNILLNDYHPGGNNIILNTELIIEPQNGTWILYDDGTIMYTANENFVGLDSLRYSICDDGFPVKCDTATVYFRIFLDENCDGIPDTDGDELFIPEGFSPDGDGVHDFFQIVGIEEFPNAKMMIFNRWGSKIFEKEKYGNLQYWGSDEEAWWWGTSEARLTIGRGRVHVGNYLYILDLGNGNYRTGTVMVSYRH